MHKIVFGIEELDELLTIVNSRKLFVVTDSSFPLLNIRERIDNIAVEKAFFSDFSPNPLFEDVCKGIELFKKEACDAILAVGGGSAIDVAKCIKLAVLAREGRDAIIPPLVLEKVGIDGSRIPIIAIPTTAGTGSESTHNAVIYYKGEKQTVTNDGILPDWALLEPKVLNTLPVYQKKCTMMDALCQGIESWWSVNSTPDSREYAQQALRLIRENWRSYILENRPYAASKIMLAANFAGRAINISATTAAHAMSYKITSIYGLPHGHAVAVCLPELWDHMITHTGDCIDPRGEEYMAHIFGRISAELGAGSPAEAIERFRKIMDEMGLENPVSVNRSEELRQLAGSVNPIRLKNNPVMLSAETLYGLYDKIVKP